MNFSTSENLFYIWLAVPVFFMCLYSWKKYGARIELFSLMFFKENNLSKIRVRSIYRSVLIAFVVALSILSLAGPRWGYQWSERSSYGSDIVVAIDLSKSMLASDVKPSRLVRAKRELLDLLQLLKGDRVGLVPFAGVSFVQCPLTADYGSVQMFLDMLDPDLIPVGGTMIGNGLLTAAKSLVKASPEESHSRSIILITDGEDQSNKLDEAIDFAKKNNIKIFTIGVGKAEGVPVPDPSGGFKKDASGKVVLSKLNAGQLRQIARETGGVYVASVAGDMDLRRIYNQEILMSAQRDESSTVRKKVWHERYQWPLSLAFLFLLVEFVTPPFRLGNLALLLFFAFNSNALNAWSLGSYWDNYWGKKSYEEKNFSEASKKFKDAEVEDPDNYEPSYNKGVSLFREQKFEQARESFKESLRKSPEENHSKIYHNLGNSYLKNQQIDEAIDSYERALEKRPDQEETKKALSYAKKLKQEQQQQKQQGEGDKDKSKSDQQQEQKGNKSEDSKQDKSQENQSESKNSEKSRQASEDEKKSPNNEKSNEDEQSAAQENEKKNQEQGDKSQATAEAEERQQSEADEKKAFNKVLELKEAEKVLRMSQDKARKYLNRPIEVPKDTEQVQDW